MTEKEIDSFKDEMLKKNDASMEKQFIEMVKTYKREHPTHTKCVERWRKWYSNTRGYIHKDAVTSKVVTMDGNVANVETKQESNASNDNPKECACDAAAELKKMNNLQLIEGFKDRINKQMQLLNEMEYSKNWQKEYDSLIFLLNALRNINKNGKDMYLSTVVRPYLAEHLQEKCQQYLKDAQTSFKR